MPRTFLLCFPPYLCIISLGKSKCSFHGATLALIRSLQCIWSQVQSPRRIRPPRHTVRNWRYVYTAFLQTSIWFPLFKFCRAALVPLLIVQKDFSSSIQWYPWNFISYVVFSSILCLLLLSLALLRITEALTRGREFWVSRYDVTGNRWTRRHSSAGLSSPPGAAGATNKGNVTNFWLGGIYVLFGRSIWKADFLWVFLATCRTLSC